MMKKLLTMLLIALASLSLLSDSEAQTVESIQNVNTICIGQIISDPRYIADFTQYLKIRLQKEGFAVSDNQKSCDATLSGHLKITETKLFWQDQSKRGKILAWGWMDMKNKNSDVLWEKDFHPYFTLKNPDFVFGDGRSGLAANLAKELAKAKRI